MGHLDFHRDIRVGCFRPNPHIRFLFIDDMRLTGTGSATVFRDGLRQEGAWSRKDDNAPFTFKNTEGQQILLSPGQPWIHVVPNEMKVTSQ